MNLFRRLAARRLQKLSGIRQRRRAGLVQGFEQLEARQLLAAFTWTGGGADTNWTTTQNWSQAGDADGVPDADDDLVFDASTAQRNSNNNLAAANSVVKSISVSADGYNVTGNALQVTSNVAANIAANNSTLGLAISGATTVTKSGAGSLVLTAANTYTGGTTINAGALKIDASVDTSTANNLRSFSIGASGTLEISTTNTTVDAPGTYAQNISLAGTGTINKTGPGYFSLFGASANIAGFAGQVNVVNGTLASNSSNWNTSAGQMSLDVGGGAALDIRTGGVVIDKLTGSGTIGSSHNVGVTLTVGANNGTSTFSGIIKNGQPTTPTWPGGANTGTIALTKAGSGILTLTGANTFTGATTISGGTLQIGAGGAAGSLSGTTVNIANGAALLYNRNDSAGEFTIAHAVSGAGAWNFTSPGGTLVGRYSLTGNNASFSGTMGITNSRVVVNAQSQLGTSSITVNPVGQILAGGAVTYSNPLTLSGSGWVEGGTFGALRLAGTWSGPITLVGSTAIGNTTGENGSITGVISGAGGALSKIGAGTLTLAGSASNTYTGLTTLTGNGQLQLSKTGGAKAIPGDINMSASASRAILSATQDNQFAAGSVMRFTVGSSDTRFELKGTTQTLGGVDSTGYAGPFAAIQHNEFSPGAVVDGTSVLILDVAGSNSFAFASGTSVIRDYNGGSMSVIKTGTGTQTFGGANFTYTGATTVDGGALELLNTTAYTSTTTVNNGGTLKVSNTANQGMNAAINLNNGAMLTHNGLTAGNNYWTNSQPVTVATGANVILNETSVTNTTGTNKGAFLDGGLKGGGGGAIVTINATNAGNHFTLRNNNTNFAGTIIVNGIASATANAGSGLAISGCITGLQNADLTVNGTLELGDTGLGWAATFTSPFSNAIGALNGSGIVVENGSSGTGNLINLTTGNTNNNGDFAGQIVTAPGGGRIALTKIGTGTQTLSGTNTYNGTTTISAGALQIGNGGTGGTLGTGAVTNNAALVFNRSDTATVANVISGTGTVTQAGSGTTTLTAANSYTGGTSINAGTLKLDLTSRSNNASLNLGALNVASGATLELFNNGAANNYGATALTATGTVFSGSGTITKTGQGVVDFWTGTSISGFHGLIDVQTGSLADQTDGSGSGSWANATGITLNVAGGAYFDLRTNSTVVDKLTGSGTIGSSFSSRTLTVGGQNGSSTFGGIIQNTVPGFTNNGQVVALTKTGSGTLTLTGANTYTGATNITAGTLQINKVGAGSNNGNVGGNQLTTSSLNVSPNALVKLDTSGNFSSANGGTTLTGAGTIQLVSGKWWLGNGGGGTAISMAAGGLIQVDAGATLTNDYANANWNLNQASLLVNGSLDLRNNNTRADALRGMGAVFDAGFTNTLTIGVANGSGTFSGTIGTGGTTVVVTKTGAGTQTFSGANTYTGATTISGGTLVYAGTNNSPSNTIASGAVLELNVTSGLQDYGTTTYSGAGTLRKTGAGTARWGFTVGTFALGNGSLIDVQGGVLDAGSSANENWSANRSSLNIASGAFVSEIAYTAAQFDALTGAGTLQMDAGAGGGPHQVTIGINDNAAGLYNAAGTATFSGAIVNGGNLIKAGSGTQTLSGSGFTYTGATTVNAGVLELKNNGSGGAYKSNVTLNGSSALWLTATAGQTSDFRGNVSGTGSVVKKDAGTVRIGTFSGTPLLSHSGNTTVEAGILTLQGQVPAGRGFDTTGTLIVNSGAEFQLSGLAAQSSAIAARFGALSGSGIIRGGYGTPFLEVGNGNGGDVFSGAIVNDGAVVLSLIKSGSGSQTLSGASTYSGSTTINGGTLLVSNSSGSATGSGAVTVNAGTLGGTGSITSSVSVASGATLAPGGSPGTLTVGGATFASGGKLAVELIGTGDQLKSTGTVNLTNATLVGTSPASPAQGTIFTIVDGANASGSQFAGLTEGALVIIDGVRYHVTYGGAGTLYGLNNTDVALVRNSGFTAVDDNPAAILEDGTLNGNVKSNDVDADQDGIVNVVASPTNAASFTFNAATGAYTYVPVANYSGVDSFTYYLTDDEFTSATVTVNLTITAVADVPTLSVPASVTGGEATAIALGITSSLNDTNGTLPEVLTITVSGVPVGASLSNGTASNGGATYTLTPAQLAGLTLIKNDNDPSDAPFTLTVIATATESSNGNAIPTAPQSLSVKVSNQAPQPNQLEVKIDGVSQGNPAAITSAPGIPVTFVVATNDPSYPINVGDADPDAPFSFVIDWKDGTTQPGTATAEGQQLTFIHDYADQALDVYQPTLTVTDKDGTPVATINLATVTLSNVVLVGDKLLVGGSEGVDRIVVQRSNAGVNVRINNVLSPTFNVPAGGKVVVHGNGGNDTISISSLTLPVELYGDDGNDYLAGSNQNDTLDGGEGDDRVLGGNGNDTLYGGDGADTLSGGAGNDLLSGDEYVDLGSGTPDPSVPHDIAMGTSPGADTLNGDAGNDTLLGGAGNDVLTGGLGNDYLQGDDDDDRVDGGDGNDMMLGSAGADTLYGRAGRDVMIGGDGTDTVYGGTGADLIYGGDATLNDQNLAFIWLNFATADLVNNTLASNRIADNSVNDNVLDILHGEADADWYLTNTDDVFTLASEMKSPNKVIKL